VVTIKAETYVPAAQLVCPDDRARMSDNFFELLPGIEKTVRIADCGEEPELRLVQIVKEGK
jgi:hypothetical protein